MAFKVAEVASILQDYDLRIKTRALPSYIDLDKFKGYVDDIRNVLKQSKGDNITFTDYNQFMNYMRAMSHIQSVMRLPEERALQRNLKYPPRTLKYLKKIRERWLLRRNSIIVPQEYIYDAAKRSQAFKTQFNPVADFKFDRARYEAMVNDLIHRLETENSDKGKEVDNVMIEYPKLNQEQIKAMHQLYVWGFLLPTDPKYTISYNDLDNAIGKTIEKVVPNIAQIRAKQAHKAALEAEEAEIQKKKIEAAEKAEEAARKQKEFEERTMSGKQPVWEQKEGEKAASPEVRTLEEQLAASKLAGAQGVPEPPTILSGSQAPATVGEGGVKASAAVMPMQPTGVFGIQAPAASAPVPRPQTKIRGGEVPVSSGGVGISQSTPTITASRRRRFSLQELLNFTFRQGTSSTSLTPDQRKEFARAMRGMNDATRLPFALLRAIVDQKSPETIREGLLRVGTQAVGNATRAVGGEVARMGLDVGRAITGGIGQRADKIVIGGIKPLEILRKPVEFTKYLYNLPGDLGKSVSHKIKLEMYRSLAINFKLTRKAIFNRKTETDVLDLAKQLVLNYGAKYLRDLATYVQKGINRVTGASNAVANVKTASRLQRLAAMTPEQLQEAISKGKSAFVAIADGAKATWQFAKAGLTYGLPMGVAISVFSGSLPVGAAVGLGLTALKGYDFMLASRSLKLSNGYGQYMTVDQLGHEYPHFNMPKESLAYENLMKSGNFYSNSALAVKSANSGLFWGSIAFAVAPLLGINPIIAGAAAFTAGAGGSLAWNYTNGKLLKSLIQAGAEDSLLAKVIRFPFMNTVALYLNGLWLADQLRMIKNVYHGDLGKYFAENYNVFDSSKSIFAILNWLSAVGTVTSMMEVSAAVWAANLARAGISAWRGIGGLNSASISATAGFLTSMVLLTAFGVPLGPLAIAGGIAGGLLGVPVGLFLAAPEGFFTAPVTVYLSSLTLSSLFAYIGSFFDRMLNSFVGNALAIINGISALLNLFSISRKGLRFENMIPLAMALMGFITALKQSAEFNGQNDCLPLQPCPTQNSSEGSSGLNPIDLKYYGVSVISKNPDNLTPNKMRELMTVLDEISANDPGKGKRQVVIVFGLDEDYFDDSLAVIGLSDSDITDSITMKNKLNNKFSYLNRLSLGN